MHIFLKFSLVMLNYTYNYLKTDKFLRRIEIQLCSFPVDLRVEFYKEKERKSKKCIPKSFASCNL